MPLRDPVTRLPIEALFHDRLSQAVALAARRKRHIAIVQLAISGIDNLATQTGLVLELAQRLVRQLRESDTVSRLGSHDFSILLNDIDSRAAANAVAEELILAIRQPVDVEGTQLHLDAYYGLALFPDDGDDEIKILRAADDALHKAEKRRAS